ncbi:MAG: hypothetical protein QOK28_3353 [Actinomycetota bacterium]|jgi:hypothetical protein
MAPLDHVLWIGGPSGAGKSTIARQLVRRWGLRLYACDTRTWDHRDRAISSGVDAAIRWEALSPAERDALSADEHRALEAIPERQDMVVDDLIAFDRTPLVLAEGALLPARVADPARSVWLVPTAEFQARHRHDPERRTESQDRIVSEATARGIPIVVVDGRRSVQDLATAVEVVLGDALRAGPTATTITERRALLRQANLDVVHQIRSGCARSWATADADSQVRTFTCECGDPACQADVVAVLGLAGSAPVAAYGHALN